MGELERFFRSNQDRVIHKWTHYFDVYERHFRRFRGRPIHLLEIGVSHGGSLGMWKHYFGPQATVYGVDVDERCKEFEDDQTRIFIGSQEDRSFLRALRATLPPLDILIDDGGHTMRQQITTFEELFGHVRNDGVYLCEDLHTSYWRAFQGGFRRKRTFIEYSKHFIDLLHAWHSESRRLPVTDFTRSAQSLHYYNGVLVIEKHPMTMPFHEQTGTVRLVDDGSDRCRHSRHTTKPWQVWKRWGRRAA